MKGAVYFIGVVLITFLLNGCKKNDEYVYPSVMTEILCARTNELGSVSYLETDRKKTYKVLNGNVLTGMSKDSIYRVYCVYELSTENQDEVTLYSFRHLLSLDPLKANRFPQGIKDDPVKPVSVWKSGDYVNLSLNIMSQDLKKHRFHVVDNGVSNIFGHKVLELSLYHDQGGDVEAYFQSIYMSIPLRNYADVLTSGDYIQFKINTFSGFTTFVLNY